MKAVLPKTVKRIAVLDRTEEPGANGEPLYLDVVEAFAKNDALGLDKMPLIVGGRYGLSSKDTTPAQILAVFENLSLPEPRNQLTIGIVDDVTFTSLPQEEEIALSGESIYEAKFYGLGADGTVGPIRIPSRLSETIPINIVRLIFVRLQKVRRFTCSHLRLAIPHTFDLFGEYAQFCSLSCAAYLNLYDVTKVCVRTVFLLNTIWEGESWPSIYPPRSNVILPKGTSVFIISTPPDSTGDRPRQSYQHHIAVGFLQNNQGYRCGSGY